MDDEIDGAKLSLPYVNARVTVQELFRLGLNGICGTLRDLLSFQRKLFRHNCRVSEWITRSLLFRALVNEGNGSNAKTALEVRARTRPLLQRVLSVSKFLFDCLHSLESNVRWLYGLLSAKILRADDELVTLLPI